jgi:hypothetical protein
VAPFALVHAPLAGASTWRPVADALTRRGHDAITLGTIDWRPLGPPYWPAFAAAAAHRIDGQFDAPCVLVGHSGAGLMLPLIGSMLRHTPAAYVFVDAVIPQDGLVPDADGHFAARARDGDIPPFPEAALRAAGIEDASVRATLLAELAPLPLAVYLEPVPVPAGWPDAPVACLRFTRNAQADYDTAVARARREAWPVREIDGGHFHMLTEPVAVADALTGLAAACAVT